MPIGFGDPYTIRHATAVDTDAEGRTSRTFTNVAVVGYVAMGDFGEVARASADGERFDAVALAPHGTTVALADQIVVAAHPEAWLVGTYEVTAVRTNRLHLRILMRRWEPDI